MQTYFDDELAKFKEKLLTMGSYAESAVSPVSYTHLDVYKRQRLRVACGSRRDKEHGLAEKPALDNS